MVFLGSYKPSFDKKSRRVALPKRIRDYLTSEEIVLSLGFEKCVFGYDSQVWRRESQKHLAEPVISRHGRDIRRFLFSAAVTVRLDGQGRLIMPSDLLKYAKIKKPIVIGAGDHFEIWEETNWNKYQIELPKN